MWGYDMINKEGQKQLASFKFEDFIGFSWLKPSMHIWGTLQCVDNISVSQVMSLLVSYAVSILLVSQLFSFLL